MFCNKTFDIVWFFVFNCTVKASFSIRLMCYIPNSNICF